MKVRCELFTYFSTTFHPNRFMFSFRSVTRHDLKPAPATDEIGAESRGASLFWFSWWAGDTKQTNKQTNKQTGKQMELSYGSLWPLCLKSPFMNCTVRCDGVKVFMYKYGNRNTFDGFLLDNVFVSVRYPR